MSDDPVQTGEAAGSDSPATPSGGDEVTSIIESAAADLSAKEPAAAAVTGVSGPSEKVPGASLGPTPPSPAPSDAAPAKPSPSKAESAAEEAELQALEQELVAKDGRVATGRIAVSRHQAVLTRARKLHEAQLAQAAQRIESLKGFESREFQERLAAFQIAEQNPDRFLQILQALPEYKARIDALIEDRARQYAPAPAEAEAEEDAEPQPDTLLEGGGMGYSTERANQLWAWRLGQAQRAFDEKLARLEEGLAPIKEERQTRERIEQAFQRQGGILQDARRSWPLFAQYEGKIRDELSKPGNERMQLDQAYRVVVVQAERVDRARIEAEARAQIHKELNGQASAPRSFRPGLPPVSSGKDEGGADEIETIIRNAARSIEGR